MTPRKRKSPADLPQSADKWFFAVRKMRTWIVEEEQEPYRPYLFITMDRANGLIRDILIAEKPTTEKAKEALFAAMLKPQKMLNTVPQRPAQVHFEDRALMTALAPSLQEIDIRPKYSTQTELLNEIISELEEKMHRGEPELPGLLSQPKVSRKMVEDLFNAAADFYRAPPWIQLCNEDILSIQAPPHAEPHYVQVLGQGGVEYGLSIYKDWEGVERMYQLQDTPEDQIPAGRHTLVFLQRNNRSSF